MYLDVARPRPAGVHLRRAGQSAHFASFVTQITLLGGLRITVYDGNMRFTEYFNVSAALALLVASVLSLAPLGASASTQLIMVEQDDCPYCEKFHHEIGPAYPKTDEGRTAPLRIVKLHDKWPAEFSAVQKATVTPTFILIEDNREIDRIVGYPGDEYFWFLLGEMLDKRAP